VSALSGIPLTFKVGASTGRFDLWDQPGGWM